MDLAALITTVESLVTPIVTELGCELIDTQLLRDQGRWVLRLFVDYPEGGITLDHCAKVSRAVEGVLDVEANLPMSYHLEVSSPGLDRVLKRPDDFARAIGRVVDIRTREPMAGRAHYKGTLVSADATALVVEIDGQPYTVPVAVVARARLKYFLS